MSYYGRRSSTIWVDTVAAVIANKRACFEPSPAAAAAAIPEVHHNNYNSKYTSLLLRTWVVTCVCV